MSTTKTNPTPKETPANPAITAMPDADPIQILTDDLRAKEKQLDAANAEILALKERVHVAEKNPLLFAMLWMDAGAMVTEAGEKLSALSEKVSKLNTAGTMTIKIKVKPMNNALLLSAEVSVKAPEPDRIESVFFRHPDGLLALEDPRQGKFKFGKRAAREDEE